MLRFNVGDVIMYDSQWNRHRRFTVTKVDGSSVFYKENPDSQFPEHAGVFLDTSTKWKLVKPSDPMHKFRHHMQRVEERHLKKAGK